MNFVCQLLFNGIALGIIYFMIAAGLTLIFGIMRQVNNAHGIFYGIGGLLCYYLIDKTGMNILLAIICVAGIMGMVGVILERAVFKPSRDAWIVGVLASTGVWFILEAFAWDFFGVLPRSISTGFEGSISIGAIHFSLSKLLGIGVGIGSIIFLIFVVHKTVLGYQMQAVQENREVAALQGINVNRIYRVSFFIGSAMAGIAGCLAGIIFNIDAGTGVVALVKAFIIMGIGGLGSIPGATIAALIVGLTESIVTTLWGSQVAFMSCYALLLAILLVKPMGLWGKSGE
jgi:branched-chain amino acid transport system permease protein